MTGMTDVPHPTEKYELTRDQLFQYIELELWGRFQKRLWATVGIVLTGITVAGLLGVPYYIRTEVDSRIRASTETFERKSADLLAHAKLLIVVSATHDEARTRMLSDAYRLLEALDDLSAPSGSSADEVGSEVRALVSKGPTESLLSKLDQGIKFLPDDDAKRKILPGRRILPSKSIVQEIGNDAAAMASRSFSTHPVHDGTMRGALQDLRFQAVVVDTLRLTEIAIGDRIRSLGGSSPTDIRIEEAKVAALETALFQPEFTRILVTVVANYLDGHEKTTFARVQGLYLQGISDTTAEIPQEPKRPGPGPVRPTSPPSK